MIKNIPFGELISALVTPFKNDKPDLFAFEKILEFQCTSKNIDGIILFGTTGESLSLCESEKKMLFLEAKEVVNNRLPIIVSISEPVTKNAVSLAQNYTLWGADGIMAINPYYYITTSYGTLKHFESITKSTNLPIILYNVPKRTNCDFTLYPEVLKALNKVDNIVAIKQCSNDIKALKNIYKYCNFKVYCGNDNEAFNMIENNCYGCISVCSQICPYLFKSLIKSTKNKDKKQSAKILLKLNQLFNLMDMEPNPIIIKYAVSKIFDCSPELRLPLTEANQNSKLKIDTFIKNNKEIFI